MTGKRLRHLQRYREIAACLVRNGFGYLVEEMGLLGLLSLPKRLFTRAPREEGRSVGARVRVVLEELGPTFIKLGQMLSTRPDLLPEHIIAELNKLQDQVPPFPFREVKRIIEEELGAPAEEIFAYLAETPLAAASIGQVHLARLKSGQEVVVKVQRPLISSTVETDLEILEDLATLAEHRLELARRYHIRDLVEEFARNIRAELNYTWEARNAERFAQIFAGDERIFVPRVSWEYTTRRVLTLECFRGVKINDTRELKARGYDLRTIARRLIEAYLHQVLIAGFFHGDPHPGNLMVLPGEVIGFTDFGLMGKLPRELKRDFTSLLLAIINRNTDGIVKAALRIGVVLEDVDLKEFRDDVEELQEKYYNLPLSQISFAEALQDFFRLAHRHRIQIPADVALLGKTFLTLEGIITKLAPDLSIFEMVVPFRRKLVMARFQPREVVDLFWRNLVGYGELLLDIPRDLKELTFLVKKGRLRLELGVPELERFSRKLDRIGNRLSFSIVLLSFSIIMAGLIIGSALGNQPSIFRQMPAIEFGFAIATVMFLWLIFSIFRSGKL